MILVSHMCLPCRVVTHQRAFLLGARCSKWVLPPGWAKQQSPQWPAGSNHLDQPASDGVVQFAHVRQTESQSHSSPQTTPLAGFPCAHTHTLIPRRIGSTNNGNIAGVLNLQEMFAHQVPTDISQSLNLRGPTQPFKTWHSLSKNLVFCMCMFVCFHGSKSWAQGCYLSLLSLSSGGF